LGCDYDFHVNRRDLLHAANLRHGTGGFISLPNEGMLWIFLSEKIPTASAGFEPAILGTRGQNANHSTTEVAKMWSKKWYLKKEYIVRCSSAE
jgi:hypothetical protein